jgi:thymidylate synthase (FAD)
MTIVPNEEIADARSKTSTTLRPTVDAMEEILYVANPVLDHGFVRVVDYMGNDDAVVQAARVSYGRGTRRTSEDRGLIRYLLRHRHTTPFEMCEIKFHVKLPIFVARQWIRHRTANVNEYSARYSILDKEFYVPSPEHLAVQSSTNKQGRADVLPADQADAVIRLLREEGERSYDHYLWLLNENSEGPIDRERDGLARELARIGLGVNTYTQWYWKVDLHNLMHFLKLRADPHAQYEIRAYAEAMLGIMQRWVPISYEAFQEYQLGAATLSASAIALVRRALNAEALSFEESGLSRREWDELNALFDLTGCKLCQ